MQFNNDNHRLRLVMRHQTGRVIDAKRHQYVTNDNQSGSEYYSSHDQLFDCKNLKMLTCKYNILYLNMFYHNVIMF